MGAPPPPGTDRHQGPPTRPRCLGEPLVGGWRHHLPGERASSSCWAQPVCRRRGAGCPHPSPWRCFAARACVTGGLVPGRLLPHLWVLASPSPSVQSWGACGPPRGNANSLDRGWQRGGCCAENHVEAPAWDVGMVGPGPSSPGLLGPGTGGALSEGWASACWWKVSVAICTLTRRHWRVSGSLQWQGWRSACTQSSHGRRAAGRAREAGDPLPGGGRCLSQVVLGPAGGVEAGVLGSREVPSSHCTTVGSPAHRVGDPLPGVTPLTPRLTWPSLLLPTPRLQLICPNH